MLTDNNKKFTPQELDNIIEETLLAKPWSGFCESFFTFFRRFHLTINCIFISFILLPSFTQHSTIIGFTLIILSLALEMFHKPTDLQMTDRDWVNFVVKGGVIGNSFDVKMSLINKLIFFIKNHTFIFFINIIFLPVLFFTKKYYSDEGNLIIIFTYIITMFYISYIDNSVILKESDTIFMGKKGLEHLNINDALSPSYINIKTEKFSFAFFFLTQTLILITSAITISIMFIYNKDLLLTGLCYFFSIGFFYLYKKIYFLQYKIVVLECYFIKKFKLLTEGYQ